MSSKITDLGALTGASAANDDLVPVVDVSDTTMAASGTNKKMTMAELSAKLSAVGPTGPTGASWQREALSDWQSPYSYIGVAAAGSTAGAPSWKVTRITVSGSSVSTAVASPIKWTDRTTATYI